MAPVDWPTDYPLLTDPTPLGEGGYDFIASTPPISSESSLVIWDWRARLYCMVRDLTIFVGGVGGGFHGDHAGDVFAGDGVEEGLKRALWTVRGRSSSRSSLGLGEKS